MDAAGQVQLQQWMARIEALAERIAAAQTSTQADEPALSQAGTEPAESSPSPVQSPAKAAPHPVMDTDSQRQSPHMVHLQLGSPGDPPVPPCGACC